MAGLSALSSTSVTRQVGGLWDFVMTVRDEDGRLTADLPVLTVTDPSGTPAAVTVDTVSSGVYYAKTVLTSAGRWLASAVTAEHGTLTFTAWADPVVANAGMPTLDDLRGDPEDPDDDGYLGANSYTDAEIQEALDAEAAAQRGACAVPAAYPADLRVALLRRVQRHLVMKSLPLAVLRGDAEADTVRLGGVDPEVRRLEARYPRLVVG